MEVAAYWLLTLLAGQVVADAVPLRWGLVERMAAAALLGVVGSTIIGYVLALWLGVSAGAALGGPAVLLLVGLSARGPGWLRRARAGPARWRRSLAGGLEERHLPWAMGVGISLGAVLLFIFTRTLSESAGGGLVSAGNVWADWSVHASYAQSFLLGHNVPPLDSLEAATKMRYPFLVDFQPALLESLGQNLYGALDMASFVVSWAATILIWHLALRLTNRPLAATIAVTLVLLGGGLGFYGAYADGCQQLATTQAGFDASSCTHIDAGTPGAVVSFIGHIPAELTHLPRSYDGQGPATPTIQDLEWYEPLLVYWMPQRDFAFGMGMVALIAMLVWEAVQERRRGILIAAGVMAAALPFFNPFGYMVAGLLGLWWLGRRWWGAGLAAFVVPLLALGLPQIWLVISGPHGQLNGPVGSNLFPQVDLGWLSHATTICTSVQFHGPGGGVGCDAIYLAGSSPATIAEYVVSTLSQPSFYTSFAGFWISNTGMFTLLALALTGLCVVPGRIRDECRKLGLIRFWAPFWVIFLMANLVVTQPWNWDNTKLLSYWYLGAAIPVAWLLVTVPRGLAGRIISGLVVASLVLSGVLSLDAAFVGQSNLAQAPVSGAQVTFAGTPEQQVAAVVRVRTSPKAVFLTEGQPNDPVTILAGRSVVLAYDGWLWSYGQPLRHRYDAVEAMYAGCSVGARCTVASLLREFRVSYVEFEPGDYNDIKLNRAWYESQDVPVLVRSGGYVIYDVRSLWARPG
jgi:hypothetical protein